MRRRKLTQLQQEFYQFLRDHASEYGSLPTYRVIMDHFGYTSPNSVTQNMKALRMKGWMIQTSKGYTLRGEAA